MDDRRVAAVLSSAVAIIDPVLDLLAERDPIGLKGRTSLKSRYDIKRVHQIVTRTHVIHVPLHTTKK